MHRVFVLHENPRLEQYLERQLGVELDAQLANIAHRLNADRLAVSLAQARAHATLARFGGAYRVFFVRIIPVSTGLHVLSMGTAEHQCTVYVQGRVEYLTRSTPELVSFELPQEALIVCFDARARGCLTPDHLAQVLTDAPNEQVAQRWLQARAGAHGRVRVLSGAAYHKAAAVQQAAPYSARDIRRWKEELHLLDARAQALRRQRKRVQKQGAGTLLTQQTEEALNSVNKEILLREWWMARAVGDSEVMVANARAIQGLDKD